MALAAFAWIGSVLLMSAVQLVIGAIFARRLRTGTSTLSDDQCSKAAIVLCLRGADPFLRHCLDRLAAQDYRQFEIWIVFDSPSDPAGRIVGDWLVESGVENVHLTTVERDDLSRRASLKTNALRHAIGQLGDDIDVVVLVDADTLAYPGWLRQMVAPFADGKVGVVSGNRWYSPQVQRWGSLVRFVYNAFSVVPMEPMQAIWPGSLSMRREIFADSEFIERMQNTSCEDAAILETMRRAKLRLAYTYDCIMLNREETTLGDCYRFVQRQLLWTRLCNAHWNAALAGSILVYANIMFGLLLMGGAFAAGQTQAATGIALTMIGLVLFNFLFLEWLHRAVSKRIKASQGDAPEPFTWKIRLRLVAVLSFVLPFYTLAAITATVARRVHWRGITYAVEPPDGIRMLGYAPYTEEPANSNSVQSL